MPTNTAPEGLKWFGADIVKVSPNTDGTCLVFGRVAGDTLDDDKQILDKGWLDVALPEWGERGNVRAMHQLISAGKMQSLTDNGASGWDLVSKIVDPTEVKKCLEGLYTGYSVGIKTPIVKADKLAENGRIVGGKVIEVSLADRPCDPTNKLALVDKVAALPSEDEVADAVKADAKKKPKPKKSDDDDDDDDADDKKKLPWQKAATITEASRDILKLLIEHEANEPTAAYSPERVVETYATLTKASFTDEVPEGDVLKLATAADEMLAAAIPNVEKIGSPIGVTQATTSAFAGMRNTLQSILDRNRRPKGDGPTAVDPESADPADSPSGDEGRGEKAATIDAAIDRLLLKAAVVAEPVTKAASTDTPMSDILTKLDAVSKAVQPDVLKANLSAVIKPLEDRIAEMEKLAAPGGPMLGGQRTMTAPDAVKASIAAQRLSQFEGMLDSPDPRIAQGARQALTEAGYFKNQ